MIGNELRVGVALALYLSLESEYLICLVLTPWNDNMLNPRTLEVFLGQKSNALF